MRHRVGISGSYGGMNLGDEAILEVVLQQLRSSMDVEIVVFSRNPQDTQQRYNVRSVSLREMHKEEVLEELKNLNLFVLGGGGILFDGLAEEFLRDVNWAKDMGVPVMVYAVSVGPLQSPETKRLVVETLNRVDKITVRETEAKKILHDLGVQKEIEVTADPALLLQLQPFPMSLVKEKGLDSNTPLIGFSVREPGLAAPDLNVNQYHAILANLADFAVERFNAHILFVPMEQGEHRDLQHSHSVISKMANAQRAHVLKGNYTPGQILGLFKHFSFAIGMRLHFLIFAALHHLPFVSLPYASKISGFLLDLEMPMPPINELNIGKLCAFLDSSWDRQSQIRKQLEQKLPLLKARAESNNQILCNLLTSL